MGNYQVYIFIFFGLLLGSRIFLNRQFYKLSDEDKLKLLNLNKSVATVSYIFYGVIFALFLLAIYAFDVDAFLAVKILLVCLLAFLIVFSIRSYRRLRAAQIIIPHYKTLLIVRLALFAVLFVGILFYLNEEKNNVFSNTAFEHLEEARHKCEKGDYKAAIDVCNALIQSDSTVSTYYIHRGIYRFNYGDEAGAHLDWTHAMAMGDTAAKMYLRSYSK